MCGTHNKMEIMLINSIISMHRKNVNTSVANFWPTCQYVKERQADRQDKIYRLDIAYYLDEYVGIIWLRKVYI